MSQAAVTTLNIENDAFGWMHKKGESKGFGYGSTKYRKRFFVLKDGLLSYFKTVASADRLVTPRMINDRC